MWDHSITGTYHLVYSAEGPVLWDSGDKGLTTWSNEIVYANGQNWAVAQTANTDGINQRLVGTGASMQSGTWISNSMFDITGFKTVDFMCTGPAGSSSYPDVYNMRGIITQTTGTIVVEYYPRTALMTSVGHYTINISGYTGLWRIGWYNWQQWGSSGVAAVSKIWLT